MKFLGATILTALLLLTVFTLANWSAMVEPTLLSFVAFGIEGPLGIILLAATLIVTALFTLYALALRTNMLMETRRHNQELQAQRKLAESAETSRFNELRGQIEHEFAQLRGNIGDLDGRLDGVEQSLRKSLDESANSLAALVGEMDDKLDRALARDEGA